MKRRIKTSMNNKPGPNKLECCITLGCKGLLEKDTLAYWTHSRVTKKMKCEHDPRSLPKSHIWSHIQNTSFSFFLKNGPNKLECLSV